MTKKTIELNAFARIVIVFFALLVFFSLNDWILCSGYDAFACGYGGPLIPSAIALMGSTSIGLLIRSRNVTLTVAAIFIIFGLGLYSIKLYQYKKSPAAAFDEWYEHLDRSSTTLKLYAAIPTEGRFYQSGEDGTPSFGPAGFTIDKRGEIWIASTQTKRVYHFDSGGALLASWTYPDDINVTDFFTKDDTVVALDQATYYDPVASIATIDRGGSLLGAIKLDDEYSPQNGYVSLTHDDRGTKLAKEFGASYLSFTDDGTARSHQSLTVDGHSYRIRDGKQLLIDDVVAATREDREMNMGTLIMLGPIAKGVCIAEEKPWIDNQGAIAVDTALQCFSSAGQEILYINYPIRDVTSFNRHFATGEDGNLYALKTLPDRIEIYRAF